MIIDNEAGELSLEDWIKKNPNVLGQKVLKKFDGHFPFLFKVLSVNKALSIQVRQTLKDDD